MPPPCLFLSCLLILFLFAHPSVWCPVNPNLMPVGGQVGEEESGAGKEWKLYVEAAASREAIPFYLVLFSNVFAYFHSDWRSWSDAPTLLLHFRLLTTIGCSLLLYSPNLKFRDVLDK
ncbi:hypothetical protein EI94DRAFT_1701979 [Lactarius quietus]|nr:hypothetical protein EI94DRAFT_1701979 [Lactarius quietus]